MVDRRLDFDDKSTAVHVAVRPAATESRSFLVTVTEGPDEGASIAIDDTRPSVLVGQSQVCELRLTDPAASRRHLRLEVVGARLRVSDLESKNGTFINDVQVQEGFVSAAAVVCLGGTRLQVTPAPASAGQAVPDAEGFGGLLGESLEMRRLYPLCARLAATDVPVLIEGETGTGKEVLAEALHHAGHRSAQPFVVFDCTAVPPSMVEAQLFGHERGSFTGAVTTRLGVFERAHHGTLLIDEIGDFPLDLQPKLLRVVERGQVQRLGGDVLRAVDVRILAATRRDLDREVQAGRFRDDLFHRLAVARVELPPLRSRRDDIVTLARHFHRSMGGEGGLPAELLRQWQAWPWPGNVRELRNAVARRLALGDLEVLGSTPFEAKTDEADLEWIDRAIDPGLPLAEARQRVIEEFERRYIQKLLATHGGSVKRAAEAAGVAKRYFQVLKARVLQSE